MLYHCENDETEAWIEARTAQGAAELFLKDLQYYIDETHGRSVRTPASRGSSRSRTSTTRACAEKRSLTKMDEKTLADALEFVTTINADRPEHWIELESGAAVPASMLDWWDYLHSPRRFRLRVILPPQGRELSTSFIGFDHAFRGPPMIYETMLFPTVESADGLECWWYATRESAAVGHRKILVALLSTTDPGEQLERARALHIDA